MKEVDKLTLAKQWYDDSVTTKREKLFLEQIFPELKESEDERIRKELIEVLKQLDREKCPVDTYPYLDFAAWLEKQGNESVVTDALIKAGLKTYKDGNKWCVLAGDNIQDGICGFGDTVDEALFEFLKELIEKRGEQKSQGKPALEVWKDMRLEVYQQASGNRHEPNCSDDATKMFSLTDIDEIFEKVAEKQCEQKKFGKENISIHQKEKGRRRWNNI